LVCLFFFVLITDYSENNSQNSLLVCYHLSRENKSQKKRFFWQEIKGKTEMTIKITETHFSSSHRNTLILSEKETGLVGKED
jgi:hypothetical protein